MRMTIVGSGSYKSSLSFRLIKLANEIKSHKFDVTVVLPSTDKYNNFRRNKDAKIKGLTLVQPWQLRTHNLIINLIPYLTTALVSILKSKPDIIYIYKPTPITMPALLAKFILNVPLVLDLDDLGSSVMQREGRGQFYVRLVGFCEHITIKYADSLTVASTYLKETIQKGYPSKSILVVPNGVDTHEYVNKEGVESKLRPYVYYFGSINSPDLVEPFIRTLPDVSAVIPDVQYVVIGAGSSLDHAKDLVRELKVSENITFEGWVEMYAVQDYTSFGDIAICYQPNTETVRAASNMKVFQYMAMSSVPIVSNVGDLPAYVQNGKLGCVVPADNPKELSKTIIELLENPSMRVKIAHNARLAAQDEYSWAVLGETIWKFIAKIDKDTTKALPKKENK